MEIGARVPGAARLHLADGIPLLRPAEQAFTAMLEGWRIQQLARNPRTRDDRRAGARRPRVHRPRLRGPLVVDRGAAR